MSEGKAGTKKDKATAGQTFSLPVPVSFPKDLASHSCIVLLAEVYLASLSLHLLFVYGVLWHIAQSHGISYFLRSPLELSHYHAGLHIPSHRHGAGTPIISCFTWPPRLTFEPGWKPPQPSDYISQACMPSILWMMPWLPSAATLPGLP